MPKTIYRNRAGKRVPSVTTILSGFKDAGALIRWANRLGRQGLDSDRVRDHAADCGSVTHELIRGLLTGSSVDKELSKYTDEARTKGYEGFKGFLRWWAERKLKPIQVEYKMVSEVMQCGGTGDLFASNADGEVCYLDWKTSNRLYADNIPQPCAYAAMWEELHPDQPVRHLSVHRFGKTFGEHTPLIVTPEARIVGLDQFKILRKAYDNRRELERSMR